MGADARHFDVGTGTASQLSDLVDVGEVVVEARQSAPDMDDLRLFDTCVTLGYMTTNAQCLTADNVLDVMDKHYIAEALVVNNEARVVYPRARGNRRSLACLSGFRARSGFTPCGRWSPPQTGSSARQGDSGRDAG